MKKKNKGITLIALVITIIVLLILAGVSIATLGGDNGIIGRARKAKTTTEEKQAEEEAVLLVNEYEMYKKMCEAEGKESDVEEFLEKNYKDKYKVEDGKYKIETESGENLEIDDKGNVKLNDEVVKANSVGSITISGLKEVEVGSNITLTVTINESNAIYKSIEWKCDNNSKATISQGGSNCIVTGAEEGRVVITCSITNYDQTQVSQEYEIEIKGKSVKSITITGNTSVNVDSNITLTATISPSDAKYQSIEWSSNNTGIATVTENGTSCTVSGKTAGMATITCTIINNNGTNISNTYNVTVNAVLPTLASKAKVGDFVNYDAGNWSSTVSLPSSAWGFGGYTAGKSKNECITPYSSYANTYSGGWKVMSISETIVTLAHVGTPAAYYHSNTSNGAYTSVTNLNNFCSNNFVNSTYASSARSATQDDIWSGKLGATGSYYWLASASSATALARCTNGGTLQGWDASVRAGVRPIVVLKAGIKTSGTASNGYGQTGWVLVN